MNPGEVAQGHDPIKDFELDDTQLSVVNERFEAFQRGEARTYPWEEVQRMLDKEGQQEVR